MFNDWLLSQLKERNWTQADLARKSGLTTASISNYVNGRTPDDAALTKLAKAFKLPAETVYRAAGVLPPVTYLDERRNDLVHLLFDLSSDDIEELYIIAKVKHDRREKKGK